MAGLSDANPMSKGTTLVFVSWACTADGSGGFTSHLVAPKEPEAKIDDQFAETPKPNKKLSPILDSETAENASTPTRPCDSAESDANSNTKNFQFSETLGKYVAYLKSIKRPKIVN